MGIESAVVVLSACAKFTISKAAALPLAVVRIFLVSALGIPIQARLPLSGWERQKCTSERDASSRNLPTSANFV